MNMHTTIPVPHTPCAPATMSQVHSSEIWHESAAAIGIISAIVDLSAVAGRLETMRGHNPRLHAVLDAEALVGRISNRQVQRQFGRGYEMIAGPSNGTCAVASLWELLSETRDNAIIQQLKAEGLPSPYDDGPTQDQADAAFDRREELDRDALSVAQAVCLVLSGGRA